MRDKKGYREQLAYLTERIHELYGDNRLTMLSTEQVSEVIGCNVKTVVANINKARDPLPAKNIGIGRKVYRVAITELARWMVGEL